MNVAVAVAVAKPDPPSQCVNIYCHTIEIMQSVTRTRTCIKLYHNVFYIARLASQPLTHSSAQAPHILVSHLLLTLWIAHENGKRWIDGCVTRRNSCRGATFLFFITGECDWFVGTLNARSLCNIAKFMRSIAASRQWKWLQGNLCAWVFANCTRKRAAQYRLIVIEFVLTLRNVHLTILTIVSSYWIVSSEAAACINGKNN